MKATFEAPTEEDMRRWRRALSKACYKIEALGASTELTELVMLVSDVSHEMQTWMGLGLMTRAEQERQIEFHRRKGA